MFSGKKKPSEPVKEQVNEHVNEDEEAAEKALRKKMASKAGKASVAARRKKKLEAEQSAKQ